MLDFPGLKAGCLWSQFRTLLIFVVLLLRLFYNPRNSRRRSVERVLTRSRLDVGARAAVGTISGMSSCSSTFGYYAASESLTTLNVLAGSLGLGVGFVASKSVAGNARAQKSFVLGDPPEVC